jgi:hypothetical protein
LSARRPAETTYRGTHDLAQARAGDDLGTFEITVGEDAVDRNAWANDDYHPWYMEGSPFGGRLVPLTYLSMFDGPELFYGYYGYPPEGSLFAKQEFEYLKPLVAGRTYRMHGRIADVYERRGRTWLRMEVSVTDADGDEVMRMAKMMAWPVKARQTE